MLPAYSSSRSSSSPGAAALRVPGRCPTSQPGPARLQAPQIRRLQAAAQGATPGPPLGARHE
eukprot:4353401-Lingulodinium_polyedra.AAC.1